MRNLDLLPDEIIVDSFAGGGGASLGIEWATGRSPDVAINHDPEAVALHAANHPRSRHYCENVWTVDPFEATGGGPVGLMWLSPDCKHFSKAKGGKPVSKKIRALAWVAIRWAAAVRPRVLILENVEEFQTWGPVLRATGKPCPRRRGATFRAFVRKLERLGYRVEWRELRACDFGAPTIRRRLFLIARCDGRAIVWPKPTHGKGRAHPWRTAAECIDWSLPCPSIFDRAKPLAEKTLKRIAAGLRRYVIDSPRPFIVPMQHVNRPVGVDEPLQTITTQGNKFNVVTPFVTAIDHASSGTAPVRELDSPLTTITAEARHALVSPYLATYYGPKREGGDRTADPAQPLPTQPTENRFGLVAPVLVPRYGEREGQAPRAMPADAPIPTIVPTQNGASLVSAFLAKHYGDRGQQPGSELFAPVSTITAQDHHALTTAHLLKLSENSIGQAADTPLHTVMAGATRFADVRAFLVAYYGSEKDGQKLLAPMRTAMSRDRMGLVTVHGVDYVIADIGMRMLAPRELYRAQSFPDSYRIDVEYTATDARGRTRRKWLTKTAQVRMCGNSVPPVMAEVLVRANLATSGATAPAPFVHHATEQLALLEVA